MTETKTVESQQQLTFAMHQPNYIPWLGYFSKMAHSDIFVYLDAVQYPRGQSFAARNLIKTPSNKSYLTIPVNTASGRDGKVKYNEVQFAGEKWRRKHLKTVELSYKRAPYFEKVFELFSIPLLNANSFVEMNIQLIENFADYLGIQSRRVRLSKILSDFGRKSELIVDISRALKAGIYLSGVGSGREYNDEILLNSHGIKLVYSDFTPPLYPQLWGEFIPRLSVLDVLFNCGPESRKFL